VLRFVQLAGHRCRLSEALATLPPATGLASTIQAQLDENFPPAKTAWVLDADWEGPVNIGDSHFDLSHRHEWAASYDGRVPRFRKNSAGGWRTVST
jgi:hypothetical protein